MLEDELGVDALEDCEPVVDCVSVAVLLDCVPVLVPVVEVDWAAATDATARSAASAAILNCVIKSLRTNG